MSPKSDPISPAANVTPDATSEPRKCRFRLDTDSSDVLILPDGRKFGYAQYGSLTGRPVLYLHGIPGSRLEGAWFDELAQKLGIRIISTDRPGSGWSSPHLDRTLLDFPKDLERLTEHLELDEYSVLGISGGGPFALACAKALPREKLKCVSIVCGIGPPDIGMKGSKLLLRFAFTVGYRYAEYAPKSVADWYWLRQTPYRKDLTDDERLKLIQQEVAAFKPTTPAEEKDKMLMSDEDFVRLFLRYGKESVAQGCDGLMLDGKLMSIDYGFRIEDIRKDLPVQLWYGKRDNIVPLNHGVQIAARIGDRAVLRVEDESHLSISSCWREEILKAIVGSM